MGRRMPNTRAILILVVEDQETLRDLLCETLRREGFETIAAANLKQARKLLANSALHSDAALVDYFLPDGEGLRLQEEFKDRGFLLISGGLTESPVAGIRFLAKPFLMTDLIREVRETVVSPKGL